MSNPYEHDDPYGLDVEDECEEPVEKCRGCDSLNGPFNYFNGWPWCRDTCYRQIAALYMDAFVKGAPVTAEEAEEHFQQRRRV